MANEPQKPANNAKEARLAAALRDNLLKRKAQARTRSAAQTSASGTQKGKE